MSKMGKANLDSFKINKKLYDTLFPVGTIFFSISKEQKFPHGEWQCIGRDLYSYIFKRIK